MIMKTKKTLAACYSFPGFRAGSRLTGVLGDPVAWVITLVRRQKKTVCSVCGTSHRVFYDRRRHRVRDLDAGGMRIYLDFEYRRVWCRRCRAVKRELMPGLAGSGRFTKRFERAIGSGR